MQALKQETALLWMVKEVFLWATLLITIIHNQPFCDEAAKVLITLNRLHENTVDMFITISFRLILIRTR